MKKQALVSLLLLTASLFAACADGGEEPATTTAAADTAADTVTEAVTEETRITLDMTGIDYGGDEFHIVNYDNITDNQWVGIPDDIFSEEETGDLLGDAVYRRNRTVEEALNIKITSGIPTH